MTNMPDFDEPEMNILRESVANRWKQEVELHPADVETRLSGHSEKITECPAIFWNRDNCSFVIIKTGEALYRCQFFYSPHEQYGAGSKEYDDIGKCVTSLLRLQADHARMRSGTSFPDPDNL